MSGSRQKRDYHVTFMSNGGQVVTELVTIENEYLAGKLILTAYPDSKIISVMLIRMFQSVCPLTGTLIFAGDPTRTKNGKTVARVDL